jgi:hypothetical protein
VYQETRSTQTRLSLQVGLPRPAFSSHFPCQSKSSCPTVVVAVMDEFNECL